MSPHDLDLLAELARTTLALAVAAMLVHLLLRLVRPGSPADGPRPLGLPGNPRCRRPSCPR